MPVVTRPTRYSRRWTLGGGTTRRLLRLGRGFQRWRGMKLPPRGLEPLRQGRTCASLFTRAKRECRHSLVGPYPGAPGSDLVAPEPSRRPAVVLKHASQLSHLLAEPGISELLNASPAAKRVLRPICRMLDTPLPGVATSDTPLSGVARQASGAPLRPESVLAPSLRPPPCPRLRLRWPYNTIANAKPA